MRRNTYSSSLAKRNTREIANCKDLLIRNTTKNNVVPFRSNKDSKNQSTSPNLSESSFSQPPSPQVTLSEALLSNFAEADSQKSSESLSSTKRDLYSQDEFNSMLEFDQLHLPEIESSRRSATLSVNDDYAFENDVDNDNLQVSMMSQISHVSELSRSQIQAAKSRTRLSNIGNSLYELSLHLRTITDVRAQVLYFRDNAPLKYYSYSCVSDLLLAALSCPPDMPYFILTMAALMVKSGNVAPSYDLKYYIRVTELLMSNPETFFVSFHADQEKPQRNLRKMLAIFQGKLADLDDDDDYEGKTGKMTTAQVERYIEMKNKNQKSSKELYIFSQLQGKCKVETIQLEYPYPVDLSKRTPNYHPKIQLDERVTLRVELFPDNYTKEEQNTYCFIKELNQDVPKPMGSPLLRFLSSSDNLIERRKRGGEIYRRSSKREIALIQKLASLFISWDVAYDASLSVWEVMKKDNKFEVEALLSQLPVSYGDFLVEAVKTFAELNGVKIDRIKNIR